MSYHQETDPRISVPTTDQSISFISAAPYDETTVGNPATSYPSSATGLSIIEGAWHTIHQLDNANVVKEGERALTVIRDTASDYQRSGRDIAHLPPLRTFVSDDGSVLIEWIFSDFRVGFSLEPDPRESGWYLVSGKNLNSVEASGTATGTDWKRVVPQLFDFALLNS